MGSSVYEALGEVVSQGFRLPCAGQEWKRQPNNDVLQGTLLSVPQVKNVTKV